jgi:hypothetical protein
MLVQMMKGYSLQELFLPGLPGLEAHLDAFERLFIQRLPKLHKHLVSHFLSLPLSPFLLLPLVFLFFCSSCFLATKRGEFQNVC